MSNTSNCIRTAAVCLIFSSLLGCQGSSQGTPAPSLDNSKEVLEVTPTDSHQGIFEVNFDGKDCTLSGPTNIPTGEYRIPLNDQGHPGLYVWIGQTLEGKTWQDALDLQSYPEEWVPAPDWVRKAKITYHGYDAQIDRYIFTYTFDEAGEYQVWLENKSAIKLWPCAPFVVFEAQEK